MRTLTDWFMAMFDLGIKAVDLGDDAETDPFMYLDHGKVVTPADTWDNTDVWAANHSRKAVGQ